MEKLEKMCRATGHKCRDRNSFLWNKRIMCPEGKNIQFSKLIFFYILEDRSVLEETNGVLFSTMLRHFFHLANCFDTNIQKFLNL